VLLKLEIQSLKKFYPVLYLTEKEGKYFLKGKLNFQAFYDSKDDMLVLNPSLDNASGVNMISDQYEIEIEFLPDFPHSLPLVREMGGRIQRIAKKYNIQNICDLHVNKNKDNTICLCPKPEEKLRYPDKVDIVHFINNLVMPFFYGLSYYDRHGKWPWREYSHGDLGILEFYAENKNLNNSSALAKSCYESLSERGTKLVMTKKRIKSHWPCLCGSKEKFRRCHKLALEGLWALKEKFTHN